MNNKENSSNASNKRKNRSNLTSNASSYVESSSSSSSTSTNSTSNNVIVNTSSSNSSNSSVNSNPPVNKSDSNGKFNNNNLSNDNNNNSNFSSAKTQHNSHRHHDASIGGGGGSGSEKRSYTNSHGPSSSSSSATSIKKIKSSSSSSSSSTNTGNSSSKHAGSSGGSSSRSHHHHNSTKSSSNSASGSGNTQSSNSSNSRFNIHDKLRELFKELLEERNPEVEKLSLRNTSFLLEKLVLKENLNTLIINLYPGNKGYSLEFRKNPVESNTSSTSRSSTKSSSAGTSNISNSTIASTSSATSTTATSIDNLDVEETVRWPYEDEDLLECIDNEEIPVALHDYISNEYPYLYYSGCIVAEIRDHRQSFPINTCDTYHVLLKPTNQIIYAGVKQLTSEGTWSQKDKDIIESQLVLATAEPICLDPNPEIGIRTINEHTRRCFFNTQKMKRQMKKYSQLSINRRRKLDQFTHCFGLELSDLLQKHRAKPREYETKKTVNSFTLPKKPTEVIRTIKTPNLELPDDLEVPSCVNVKVKPIDKQQEIKDCIPHLIKEYKLETNSANGGKYLVKLSVYKRPSNSEYLGELHVDHNHIEGRNNGKTCQFSLYTEEHAKRYIEQFTEIFTEEDRKSVTITVTIPGQEPRIIRKGIQQQQQTQNHPTPSQTQIQVQQIAQINQPPTPTSILPQQPQFIIANNITCLPNATQPNSISGSQIIAAQQSPQQIQQKKQLPSPLQFENQIEFNRPGSAFLGQATTNAVSFTQQQQTTQSQPPPQHNEDETIKQMPALAPRFDTPIQSLHLRAQPGKHKVSMLQMQSNAHTNSTEQQQKVMVLAEAIGSYVNDLEQQQQQQQQQHTTVQIQQSPTQKSHSNDLLNLLKSPAAAMTTPLCPSLPTKPNNNINVSLQKIQSPQNKVQIQPDSSPQMISPTQSIIHLNYQTSQNDLESFENKVENPKLIRLIASSSGPPPLNYHPRYIQQAQTQQISHLQVQSSSSSPSPLSSPLPQQQQQSNQTQQISTDNEIGFQNGQPLAFLQQKPILVSGAQNGQPVVLALINPHFLQTNNSSLTTNQPSIQFQQKTQQIQQITQANHQAKKLTPKIPFTQERNTIVATSDANQLVNHLVKRQQHLQQNAITAVQQTQNQVTNQQPELTQFSQSQIQTATMLSQATGTATMLSHNSFQKSGLATQSSHQRDC